MLLGVAVAALLLSAAAATPGVPRDLNGTDVFWNGLAGVPNYRIPVIVQATNTDPPTLVAFAEARDGGDSSTNSIAARTSTDGGATWSAVAFVAGALDTPESRAACAAKRTFCRVGNPAAVFDASRGRVVLVYALRGFGPRQDNVGNAISTSADGGRTWSLPHDVSADFGMANASQPGPGTALMLHAGPHTGRLLVASHHGPYVRDYISLSDDGGTTWRTINTTFPNMDEAALTQLPNGSVLLNMRHRSSPSVGRAVAISHDDGETFGPVLFDAALVSPVCQASIVSFGDATYFSNPDSNHSAPPASA
jgi:sialidase-1